MRQQRHRLPGEAFAQLARSGDRGAPTGVRLLEEAEPELQGQDPARRRVERRLLDQPPVDRLRQAWEAAVPQAQVGAGGQGGRRGRHRVPGQAHQPVQGQPVGHHHPVESPLLTQDAGQQLAVGGAGQAVELVVRGHHSGRPGPYPRQRGLQVDLVQFPGAQFGRRAVAAADRRALAREVLEDDRRPVRRDPLTRCPLRAAHQRLGEPCRQVGVLTEALLRPPPARIADQVERRHQRHVAAPRPQLGGGRGDGLLVEPRVPGGSDGQVHRQQGAVQRLVAVRHLLDHEDRHAQPGVLDHVALDGVGDARPLRRADARLGGHPRPGVRALQAVQRAHPAERGDLGAERLGEPVPAGGPLVGVPAVHPLVDLPHLLGEGHPCEQVAHPGGDRGGGVAVEGIGHGWVS